MYIFKKVSAQFVKSFETALDIPITQFSNAHFLLLNQPNAHTVCTIVKFINARIRFGGIAPSSGSSHEVI